MTRSDPGGDDTVRLKPGATRPSYGGWRYLPYAAAAGGVLVAAVLGWALWLRPAALPAPHAVRSPPAAAAQSPAVALATPSVALAPRTVVPPAPVAPNTVVPAEFSIETATEQHIRDHVPTALTVFRVATNPRIVVLDFASLREQGLMLNRVAALIEKEATPRDRVLNDAELDHAIRAEGDTIETYYYGHDYSVDELTRFFALADAEHIALSPQEESLRRLLRQLGWFASGAQGALISIPRVGADARVTYEARSAILHHELSHGEYYSDPAYVAYVHQFWTNMLTAGEQNGVRKFLASEGYDEGIEDLMENEMQAYLMFTRDPAFFTPAKIGMTPARLADLQAAFLRGLPVAWLRDMMVEPSVMSAAAPR